jgi:hypothetical protein
LITSSQIPFFILEGIYQYTKVAKKGRKQRQTTTHNDYDTHSFLDPLHSRSSSAKKGCLWNNTLPAPSSSVHTISLVSLALNTFKQIPPTRKSCVFFPCFPQAHLPHQKSNFSSPNEVDRTRTQARQRTKEESANFNSQILSLNLAAAARVPAFSQSQSRAYFDVAYE